jgi:hypothetical protein
MAKLLGVFEQPGQVADLVRRLRGRGYDDLKVYSPSAFAEVDEAMDEKPSKVRWFTLLGGLTGVVTGYAMTIWMANDWPIMIGGKPYASVAPYTVIAFELTILFGGVLTVLGLFLTAGLPSGRFGKPDEAYSARFSSEDFGVLIGCRDRDVSELDALLRAHAAKEVSLVEP